MSANIDVMQEALESVVAEQEPDLIETTAIQIETMSSKDVIPAVAEMANNNTYNDFQLGGLLSRVKADALWKGQFDSFDEFLSNIGVHYRKGMYLIGMYDKLVAADIPWAKIKHLGWTRLRELAEVITAENADEWIAKASTLNIVGLQEAVRAAKKGASAAEVAQAEDTTSLSFKVHSDQRKTIEDAIEKARKELGTEYNTVALEAICMNYLSGATVKKFNLVDVLKALSPGEAAEAFDAAYPDVEFNMAITED